MGSATAANVNATPALMAQHVNAQYQRKGVVPRIIPFAMTEGLASVTVVSVKMDTNVHIARHVSVALMPAKSNCKSCTVIIQQFLSE